MARPVGSKNKRTIEREKKIGDAIAKMEAAGVKMWKGGDAVDFLELHMRNEGLPLSDRIGIARDLAPYHRPRKTENVNINDNVQHVVITPEGQVSWEDWQKRHMKPAADVETAQDGGQILKPKDYLH